MVLAFCFGSTCNIKVNKKGTSIQKTILKGWIGSQSYLKFLVNFLAPRFRIRIPNANLDPGESTQCESIRIRILNTKKSTGKSVLRIRDVFSRIRIFSIPDPGSASKNLRILTPKQLFLRSRKYDLGCSSRIRILTFFFFFFYISRGQKGTRSRIRIRNTAESNFHSNTCYGNILKCLFKVKCYATPQRSAFIGVV